MNIPVGMLSLFLTYHFVPEQATSGDDKSKKRIDYLGFGLIATGLGCLQVVLDRGQIDDWFGSPLITTFAVIAGTALIIGLVHEMTTKDPIVAIPLMRNPSFFVSNMVMFFLGMVLFSTTQLLPQMTQDLYGLRCHRGRADFIARRVGDFRHDAAGRFSGEPGPTQVPDHVRVHLQRDRALDLDQP